LRPFSAFFDVRFGANLSHFHMNSTKSALGLTSVGRHGDALVVTFSLSVLSLVGLFFRSTRQAAVQLSVPPQEGPENCNSACGSAERNTKGPIGLLPMLLVKLGSRLFGMNPHRAW
jgi:hypothetical protein